MQVIDPTCRLGNLASNPEESDARKTKYLAGVREMCTEVKLWRLYSGTDPCSKMIEATAMEAGAWNKNARAFAGWQTSLGRVALPVFELREEDDPARASMWKVTYKEGGVEDVELVCAESKAEARRQFEKMARVTWTIKTIEQVASKSAR